MAGFDNKKTTGGSSGLTAGEVLWVQSGSAGVVKLGNVAGTPSTVAGVGQIYTKISDGLLYFLSGVGVEYNLTTGGGGMIQETPTGTVNSTNVTFTVAVAPKFIFTDTGFYIQGFGYSLAVLTVTMDLAPNSFIRAYS